MNCESLRYIRLNALYRKGANFLDARRISDGEFLMLKKIQKSVHPYEAEIGLFFSQEPLASHPMNHCIPIFDVLVPPDDPDIQILVMPLLRKNGEPSIATIGEMMEFLRQLFEVRHSFFRKQTFPNWHDQTGIAIHASMSCCPPVRRDIPSSRPGIETYFHSDCMSLNIMMDPRGLYPNMYHPLNRYFDVGNNHRAKHYTRTLKPVKYYFIDFGISRKFDPQGGPPRELPILGGDRTAPELQNCRVPIDPFPTDIYYLGNFIREEILKVTFCLV